MTCSSFRRELRSIGSELNEHCTVSLVDGEMSETGGQSNCELLRFFPTTRPSASLPKLHDRPLIGGSLDTLEPNSSAGRATFGQTGKTVVDDGMASDCSTRSTPHATLHRLRLRRHAQPLRPRPRRQGVQQSAPIIKLPADATEDDHLALLGLLNSSTACFWMKQTFHNKGSSGDRTWQSTTSCWRNSYEHTGTGLQRFRSPKPSHCHLARAVGRTRPTVQLATHPRQSLHSAIRRLPTAWLRLARQVELTIRGRMIALQEELDWQCYQLYGLLTERPSLHRAIDLPELDSWPAGLRDRHGPADGQGELQTTWFERHGSTPITESAEALARRLPQAGRTPHQADRDEQGDRPDREARVQAALERPSRGQSRNSGP